VEAAVMKMKRTVGDLTFDGQDYDDVLVSPAPPT